MPEAVQYIIDTPTLYYGNIPTDTLDSILDAVANFELGISKGGIKIELKPEIRSVEHDGGMDRRIKGMSRVTKWNAKVEGAILQFNPKLFGASLIKKDTTQTSTKYDVYVPSTSIDEADHQVLVVVGKLQNTNEPIIIILDDTFNLEGVTVDTKDNDEGAFNMVFEGHYTSGSDVPPVKILTKKQV